MRQLLRRRPSAAMLVAIAGLVVATSGDAVADGVRAVASVVGKDQVTSRSVRDGSLLLRDIKPSQRARLKGARGPRGRKGDTGTNALSNISRKSAPFVVPIAGKTPCPGTPQGSCYHPVTSYATGTVSCDPGQAVVAGGVDSDGVQAQPQPGVSDSPSRTDVSATHPTADGTGWTATVGSDDTTQPHTFGVVVLCAPATPQS